MSTSGNKEGNIFKSWVLPILISIILTFDPWIFSQESVPIGLYIAKFIAILAM